MEDIPIWLFTFAVTQFLFNIGILWVVFFHVNSHYENPRITKKHRL